MFLIDGLRNLSKMSCSKGSSSRRSSRDLGVIVPCGLVNQGMTCYLNAVLQVLFMTDKLREDVLRRKTQTQKKTSDPEENLIKALADLFEDLMKQQRAVSTVEVSVMLNITNVFEQQDAAEYLQMILHRIPKSSEIFRGIMVTSTVCSHCSHNNDEEIDFLSIPLSIDAKGKCDVRYALMEYMGIHDMSGDDQLYCLKCGSMRDMETKNDIKKWPDILTLQLKRFEMKYIENVLYYWKNQCRVEITSNIQMDSVKYESSPEYELYAIINHYGSFCSGHYVTLIKHESGNWYHFNDHIVKKIPETEYQSITYCSDSAYLLLYKKVTKEAAALGKDEETKHPTSPQTHTSEDISCVTVGHGSDAVDHAVDPRKILEKAKDNERKSYPKSEYPEQGRTTIKMTKQTMIQRPEMSPKTSTQNHSPDMFKLRLKEELQYLSKEIYPGERQKLNDVFIVPHITEELDFHISDKREIIYRNIFEGQNIRTVLMKGEAGIGKTVTVRKFILDWAEENSNHDIKYIFLIPFQKLNIIRETVKECSFMQLLQRCFKCTENLKFTDFDGIMLIFDGLNEFKLLENTKRITDVNERASISEILKNLIMGNLLPNAQIWITSRPAAANQIPPKYIHRVTEIQGFDDEQKEKYFRKNISVPRMSDEVISHIQKLPRINSMCYLPDYCRIIATIPEEMFRTGSDEFPKTLTQMYSKLLLTHIGVRKEILIDLGKIAFHLLVNGSSLFCHEDLKKYGIRDESVLRLLSIIKKTEDKSKCISFCFINHRTQEFLAALYATKVINGNNHLHLKDLSSLKLEFGELCFTEVYLLQQVLDNALQRQMDLFFCFLLGLKLESSQIALNDLLKQRSSSSISSQEIVQHIRTLFKNFSSDNADKCSLLFDALKELDDRYLIQEIKTQLKSGLRLSPAQFPALVFVLLNSEEQLDETKFHRSEEHHLMLRPVVKTSGELEICQCGIGVKGCADLKSALISNQYHLRELDLSGNFLGHLGVKRISDLLNQSQCELEKLRMRSCFINEEVCADLSSALRSNPSHLRELDLSDNLLGNSGIKKVADLLADPQCKLNKLWLSSCHFNEGGCTVLSSALRSNPSHLRKLDLSDNYIKDLGMIKLSAPLKYSEFKVEKLWLRSCHIGESGCAVLSSALILNPSHLRELDLSGNDIGDSGVKQLSDLLEDPQCKLEKLWLSSCHISERGCAYLSSALRSNLSHLRELDMSDNDIRESGIQQLSILLKDHQFKLEKLGLRSCYISLNSCHDLSSALKSNPSHLRELDLSKNCFTELGLKKLSPLLEHPQCKLEKLMLRSCLICERGCAVLSSALKSDLSYLRELDLSNNYFKDSGVKELSNLLEHPQFKLQTLRLRSCHISDRGCADLSSALKKNVSHLRELDLSRNVFKHAGVMQLSDLLANPECKLQKLGLRYCHINGRGCADLSSALSSNPSHLRELDLSENEITDSGVKQLSHLLANPQCKLEKLWLRFCYISEVGCDDLSSALRSNPSHLRELDLSDNILKDSGVKLLSDLLKDPQYNLEKLWLNVVKISHGQSDFSRSHKTKANQSASDTEELVTSFGQLEIKN